MGDVVSLQEYRPHLAGPARCLHCHHEWQAASEVGVFAGLECPECHLEKGVRAGLVYPAESMWHCECGCCTFLICRDRGPMCANCGSEFRDD